MKTEHIEYVRLLVGIHIQGDREENSINMQWRNETLSLGIIKSSNGYSVFPLQCVSASSALSELRITHYVLFINTQGVIFDFTYKPRTYLVSIEASGPAGYKFMKKN